MEVHIPLPVGDVVMDLGNMRGDTDEGAGVTHRLEAVLDLRKRPLLPHPVAHAAVMVDGDRIVLRDLADVGDGVRVFAGGLADPVHAAADFPVRAQTFVNDRVAAHLHRVDSVPFAILPHAQGVLNGVPVAHLLVEVLVDMGKAADLVAAHDQACDVVVAEPDGGKRVGCHCFCHGLVLSTVVL